MKPWTCFLGILTLWMLFTTTAVQSANLIRWSQQSYDTGEASPQAQLLVIRDGDLSLEASADFFTSSFSAKPGVDYVATNGTVRFPPNAASAIIAVDLLNDTGQEPTKQFTVTLANASPGWGLSGNTDLTVSIRDNDAGIQFPAYGSRNVYETRVGEADGQVSLLLRRSGDLKGEVWVDYDVREITAKSGEDFIGSSGRVFFGSNDIHQSIVLDIVNDTLTEAFEKQFEVILKGATPGIAIGFTDRALVTILNDDGGPYAQLSNSSGGSQEYEAFHSITIHRGVTPGVGTVKVGYRTLPGTALPGEDYEHREGVLVFEPGEQIKTVMIPLIDDGRAEDAETFGFELAQLDGEVRLPASQPLQIWIGDNDALPWSLAMSGSVDESNAGDIVGFVHRSGDLSIPQAISYRTVEITARDGRDFKAISGRLQFKAGEQYKTLTVAILDDEVVDGPARFAVELFDPSDGAVMGSETRSEIEVTDDDTGFEVEGSATEGEGMGRVRLHRGSDYSKPILVHVRVDPATEPEMGSQLVPPTEGDVFFRPGQADASFVFPVLSGGGPRTAPYGYFKIRVSQSSGPPASGLPTETFGSIEFKRFGFRLGSPIGYIPQVPRKPGRVPFAITRTGDSLGPASVDYQFMGFEPLVPGVDFVPSQGTLYFAQGETSKTVHLEFLDNPLADLLMPTSLSLRLSHARGDTPLAPQLEYHPSAVEQYYQIRVVPPPFDPYGHIRIIPPLRWKDARFGSLTGVAEQEGEALLELRRTGRLDQAESVDVFVDENPHWWVLADGTQIRPATRGVDFEPSRQTIHLSPGQSNAPVRILLHADREIEGFETLRISLQRGNATNSLTGTPYNLLILDTSVDPLRIHSLSEREMAAIVPPADERMFSDGSRLSVGLDRGAVFGARMVERVTSTGQSVESFVPFSLPGPGWVVSDRMPLTDVSLAASSDQAWVMNLTAGDFGFHRLRRLQSSGAPDPTFGAVDLILGITARMDLRLGRPMVPRSRILPQATNEFILLGPTFVNGRYTPHGARITTGVQSLDVFPQDCRILETDGARTIGILRQGDLSQPASYEWTYLSGTAIAGRDFQPGNGTVELRSGQSMASIPFTAIDNTTPELDRQLLIRFTRLGESRAIAEVELTLVNDDLGILDASVVEPARLSVKLVLAGHLVGDTRPLTSVHLFGSNDLKEWRELPAPWQQSQVNEFTSPEILVPFQGQRRFFRLEAQ